jgi:hypothetical protein
MVEEKKALVEGEVVSTPKRAKPKVKPNAKETKKTFDLFGAMFSQSGPPINFTVVKVNCVCGLPLTLHLRKPSAMGIIWANYCKDCRRHIQFGITEGPL